MLFLRRTFGALKPAFLFRSYVISGIIFALIVMTVHPPVGATIVYVADAVLFPFSLFVWTELKAALSGDGAWILHGPLIIVLYVAKFVVTVALWAFAIFVAPVGLLYLWFRTRPRRSATADQPG